MRMTATLTFLLALFVALACPAAAHAQITRLTVQSRGVAFDGRTFGDVGAYERIRGELVGEIDPKDRRNALITDKIGRAHV